MPSSSSIVTAKKKKKTTSPLLKKKRMMRMRGGGGDCDTTGTFAIPAVGMTLGTVHDSSTQDAYGANCTVAAGANAVNAIDFSAPSGVVQYASTGIANVGDSFLLGGGKKKKRTGTRRRCVTVKRCTSPKKKSKGKGKGKKKGAAKKTKKTKSSKSTPWKKTTETVWITNKEGKSVLKNVYYNIETGERRIRKMIKSGRTTAARYVKY